MGKKTIKIVYPNNKSNCLHQKTTATETKNGCFKIKCANCGAKWVE